jgi:hypothetical protein
VVSDSEVVLILDSCLSDIVLFLLFSDLGLLFLGVIKLLLEGIYCFFKLVDLIKMAVSLDLAIFVLLLLGFERLLDLLQV